LFSALHSGAFVQKMSGKKAFPDLTRLYSMVESGAENGKFWALFYTQIKLSQK